MRHDMRGHGEDGILRASSPLSPTRKYNSWEETTHCPRLTPTPYFGENESRVEWDEESLEISKGRKHFPF